MRSLYLSHGGGPLPLLADAGHREMNETLQHIAANIEKPSAIICASAHWEAKPIEIYSPKQTSLLYDYSGFPPESYTIDYAAKGDPALGAAIHASLAEHGIASKLDDSRGFDHGVFIPLKIMYKDADIPIVQVSLAAGLDPSDQLKLGEALSEVEIENALLVGSGMSYHNLRAFFSAESAAMSEANLAFENWLIDILSDTKMSEGDRSKALINWEKAPSARACHPREEHLLPLHVCYGAAKRSCTRVYKLDIMGKRNSMYYWE